MSSIQDKTTMPLDVIVNKRKSNFSKYEQLDRLQETAFYTFALAGLLLSHKTLSQFTDTINYKLRLLLHKSKMLTNNSTFKTAQAFTLYWIDAFSRYTGINVVFEKKIVPNANVEPERTYILRLQTKKTAVVESQETEINVKPFDRNTVSNEMLKSIAEVDVPALNALRSSWKSGDSESEMGSNSSISNRQNMGLILIVYGSATLVYVQLMLLAAFLQTSYTPPGLMFLVTSLAIIGVIVFKMSFVKAKITTATLTNQPSPVSSTTSSPATSRSSSSTDLLKNIETTTANKPKAHLSRATTRRFLYFHNKTLSKIKLL